MGNALSQKLEARERRSLASNGTLSTDGSMATMTKKQSFVL